MKRCACALVLILLICVACGQRKENEIKQYNSSEQSEIIVDFNATNYIRQVFNENEKLRYIIIRPRDVSSHEFYIVDTPQDIETIRKDLKKIDFYELNYYDSEYVIEFYSHYYFDSLPYPASYSEKQQQTIKSMMLPENKKYIYTFYAPSALDFSKLTEDIEQKTDCSIFTSSELTDRYSYVTLEYAAEASDSKDALSKTITVPLGEYEPDNYFLPWIELFNRTSNYYGNSPCGGRMSCGNAYMKRIKIYLNHPLAKEEVNELKEKAENEYNKNTLISDKRIPFMYHESTEYGFYVVFDEPQSVEMIEAFCKEYQIDSYDYKHEPLDIEEIVLFYNYVDQKDGGYRSYTITPDLEVAYHRYAEVEFTPFIDETPSSTFISKQLISEQDYAELIQVLINNNFRTMPNEIGFGDYEFQQYVYIGVKIDGTWYYSGGDHPYSRNARFEAIFKVFQNKFEIS